MLKKCHAGRDSSNDYGGCADCMGRLAATSLAGKIFPASKV
jgi:hypothetical protein